MKQDFQKTSRNSEIMKMSLVCHKLKIHRFKIIRNIICRRCPLISKNMVDKWNLEDYQGCPDPTIVTDVEMLLLMLFITEIKLLVLEALQKWNLQHVTNVISS